MNSANGTALPAATQDVRHHGREHGRRPRDARRPSSSAPEERAWFELSYPDVCDIILTPGSGPTATPNACYEGKWLQITPPEDRRAPCSSPSRCASPTGSPASTWAPSARAHRPVAQKLTMAWRPVDPRRPRIGIGGTKAMANKRERRRASYEQACLAEDLGQDVLALAAVAESDRPASVLRRVNGRLVRLIVEAALDPSSARRSTLGARRSAPAPTTLARRFEPPSGVAGATGVARAGVPDEAARGCRAGRRRRRRRWSSATEPRPRASPPRRSRVTGRSGRRTPSAPRPGEHLTLVDGSGSTVGTGRGRQPGWPHHPQRARRGAATGSKRPGGKHRQTAPFSVLSTSSTPPSSFYSSQHLHAGLNYVTMRDGISIAATVRLPPGKTLADGPFPTVIEYSGYATAAPHSLIDALEGKAPSSDPLLPDTATVVGSVIAPLLGFVTVSVQMRGTGCSGGAFDLFGLPSDYDGYDMIQTVGAQPWVLHHKVGMVGISYSGISQFEVAGTDPPDLAAITPLSSTDDLFSTGYPGGIYNNGFAASWIAQRIVDAEAAPKGGQPWATAEIATGDTTCLANQVLHPEAQQLESLVGPGPEPGPVAVRPALAGGVGHAHQGPRVPGGRPRGRADGARSGRR